MSALVRGVKSGASLDLVVHLAYNCVFNCEYHHKIIEHYDYVGKIAAKIVAKRQGII